MIFKLASAFSLCATAALADCPSGAQVLLICDIAENTKQLETCLSGDTVTYAYGVKGQTPELQLSRHVRDVEHTPWPGIGRWIWEEIAFLNAEYAYRVIYSFERNPETMVLAGELEVWNGDDVITSLTCDPDSIDFSGFPSPVYDAKVAAGQAWDFDTKRWIDGE